MQIDRFLEARRDGTSHSATEIRDFVRGVLDGSITRAQVAVWLAFAYLRGLSDDETVALTTAMTDSGQRLEWDGIAGPFIDKHSTGGVGDKVSLVLAPLWAELGWRVPMVSGRGLGHTGGTLDKLEAIVGYRTDLPPNRLRVLLADVGCFINGQTELVAPADRFLYDLRNETCTVSSIPLITASILSKKLSEGLDHLVLDVKVGSGAFMKDLEEARRLAQSLVRVGRGNGLHTRALITAMDQPLGRAAGNAIEVREVVETLKGRGPADLVEVTLRLAGHPPAAEVLASGAAYERFCRMVAGHGGDVALLEQPGSLEGDVCEDVLLADRDGYVSRCDALGIGLAVFLLGAGRLAAGQPVHPGVGALVLKKRGDAVCRAEPLAKLWHAGRKLDLARRQLAGAFTIAQAPVLPDPVVIEEMD